MCSIVSVVCRALPGRSLSRGARRVDAQLRRIGASRPVALLHDQTSKLRDSIHSHSCRCMDADYSRRDATARHARETFPTPPQQWPDPLRSVLPRDSDDPVITPTPSSAARRILLEARVWTRHPLRTLCD